MNNDRITYTGYTGGRRCGKKMQHARNTDHAGAGETICPANTGRTDLRLSPRRPAAEEITQRFLSAHAAAACSAWEAWEEDA